MRLLLKEISKMSLGPNWKHLGFIDCPDDGILHQTPVAGSSLYELVHLDLGSMTIKHWEQFKIFCKSFSSLKKITVHGKIATKEDPLIDMDSWLDKLANTISSKYCTPRIVTSIQRKDSLVRLPELGDRQILPAKIPQTVCKNSYLKKVHPIERNETLAKLPQLPSKYTNQLPVNNPTVRKEIFDSVPQSTSKNNIPDLSSQSTRKRVIPAETPPPITKKELQTKTTQSNIKKVLPAISRKPLDTKNCPMTIPKSSEASPLTKKSQSSNQNTQRIENSESPIIKYQNMLKLSEMCIQEMEKRWPGSCKEWKEGIDQ